MPHWKHLLHLSELYCFSTALVPWTCQFKVLTLLPQSEITVSCWVSLSMGLLSNASSSELVFASPIVLAETVICGGCPNFIFLANCCWKTRKNKQTNKIGIYIMSKTSQVQRVPLLCLKAAQKYSGQFLTLNKKKISPWGSHCCNMVGTHVSSFSPKGD